MASPSTPPPYNSFWEWFSAGAEYLSVWASSAAGLSFLAWLNGWWTRRYQDRRADQARQHEREESWRKELRTEVRELREENSRLRQLLSEKDLTLENIQQKLFDSRQRTQLMKLRLAELGDEDAPP